MSSFSRSTATAMIGSGAAAERLAHRSLYVRVRPAPANLSERRSVLRVLEQYGKVDMFKKMADNASFMLIASSTAMASTLVQRCPMQYEFMAETFQTAQPWGSPGVAASIQPIETASRDGSGDSAGGAEPEATSHAEPSSSSNTQAGPSDASSSSGAAIEPPRRRQTGHVAHKSFVLSVFPSLSYKHDEMIRMSPLHGPWPQDGEGTSGEGPGTANGKTGRTVKNAKASNAARAIAGSTPLGSTADYKNTFVFNALKAVVPDGIANEALCDWRIRGGRRGTGPASPVTDRAAARIQQSRERKAMPTRSAIASLLTKTNSRTSTLMADNSIRSARTDRGRPKHEFRGV